MSQDFRHLFFHRATPSRPPDALKYFRNSFRIRGDIRKYVENIR
jgi:hypothetical protein